MEQLELTFVAEPSEPRNSESEVTPTASSSPVAPTTHRACIDMLPAAEEDYGT